MFALNEHGCCCLGTAVQISCQQVPTNQSNIWVWSVYVKLKEGTPPFHSILLPRTLGIHSLKHKSHTIPIILFFLQLLSFNHQFPSPIDVTRALHASISTGDISITVIEVGDLKHLRFGLRISVELKSTTKQQTLSNTVCQYVFNMYWLIWNELWTKYNCVAWVLILYT